MSRHRGVRATPRTAQVSRRRASALADTLDERRVAARDVPEAEVRVSVHSLGVRADDDVGAEFERTLAKRGHGRIVDDEPSSGDMRVLRDVLNVGNVEHWVGGSLDQNQSVAVEPPPLDICRRYKIVRDVELGEASIGKRSGRSVAI